MQNKNKRWKKWIPCRGEEETTRREGEGKNEGRRRVKGEELEGGGVEVERRGD